MNIFNIINTTKKNKNYNNTNNFKNSNISKCSFINEDSSKILKSSYIKRKVFSSFKENTNSNQFLKEKSIVVNNTNNKISNSKKHHIINQTKIEVFGDVDSLDNQDYYKVSQNMSINCSE